jgi:AAA15 family ATPase/GTPase
MNIKILNYKSVRKQKIKIDKKINLFIGINESGKSNFLSAIEEIKNEKIKEDNFNFNKEESSKTEINFS